jgi:hypothetical protein
VVLSEGKNVLTGCKLTVQMKTGEAKFEACGGRIKTLLTPGLQGLMADSSTFLKRAMRRNKRPPPRIPLPKR